MFVVTGKKVTLLPVLAVVFVVLAGLHFVLLRQDRWRSPGGDLETQITSFVDHELKASGIPGASVAVVENGQTTYLRGFGDNGKGRAITPDTPFWIGSNTKSFTALAVMQLVERGWVELDAPVQRYVPEFTVADGDAVAAKITVRHLLNQTSGFSRADGIEPLLAERRETLADAVKRLEDVHLNREPGSTFEYSNLNYMLLGRVLERAGDTYWEYYVAGNIMLPLGMNNSFTTKYDAQQAGLTNVHRFWFGRAVEKDVEYVPGLAPTGWIYSSAADMARYLAMYLGGGELDGERVLSREGIDTMLTPATNQVTRQLQSERFTYSYGEGWFVGPFGAAEDARWHLGNHPAFTAWMVLIPGSNQGVVVLLNAGSQLEVAGANSVMSRIPVGVVNLLQGEDPPTGTSLQSFYSLFVIDAALLLVVLCGLLAWTIVSRPAHRSLPALGLAMGSLVLVVGVAMFAGSSWTALFSAMPDVALVGLAILGLLLLTAVVWAVRVGLSFLPARNS